MNTTTITQKYLDFLLYERNGSPYKVSDYRKKLAKLFRDLPFPLQQNSVRAYLSDARKSGIKPSTINYWITMINSFIRWCQLEKIRQQDFSDLLNKMRPKEDRTPDANDVLSVEEISLLIEPPKDRTIQRNDKGYIDYLDRVDLMYCLLFEFIYKTGSRSGEIVQIKKRDINFPNHSVTLYGTKNGDNRIIAIPPDMEKRIEKICEYKQENDYLFSGNHHITDGKPISQGMLNKAFQSRAKWSGIKRHVHIHQLRHSAITHMLIEGAPLVVVQAMVGHKRLATTSLYTHVMVNSQRDCMMKFNPLVRRNLNVSQVIERFTDLLTDMKLDEHSEIQYQIERNNGYFLFRINL